MIGGQQSILMHESKYNCRTLVSNIKYLIYHQQPNHSRLPAADQSSQIMPVNTNSSFYTRNCWFNKKVSSPNNIQYTVAENGTIL